MSLFDLISYVVNYRLTSYVTIGDMFRHLFVIYGLKCNVVKCHHLLVVAFYILSNKNVISLKIITK